MPSDGGRIGSWEHEEKYVYLEKEKELFIMLRWIE